MFEAVAVNAIGAPTHIGYEGFAVIDTDGVIDGFMLIKIAFDTAVVDK